MLGGASAIGGTLTMASARSGSYASTTGAAALPTMPTTDAPGSIIASTASGRTRTPGANSGAVPPAGPAPDAPAPRRPRSPRGLSCRTTSAGAIRRSSWPTIDASSS